MRSFSFYSCNNQHLMLVPFCLKDLGMMRTSQLPSAGTGSLLSLVPDVSYRIAQSELLWSLVFEASILNFQCFWNSPLCKIKSEVFSFSYKLAQSSAFYFHKFTHCICTHLCSIYSPTDCTSKCDMRTSRKDRQISQGFIFVWQAIA